MACYSNNTDEEKLGKHIQKCLPGHNDSYAYSNNSSLPSVLAAVTVETGNLKDILIGSLKT